VQGERIEFSRRGLLGAGAGLCAVAAAAWPASAGVLATGSFPVSHSEAEWRKMLTEQQYYVLREAGTERAFTSPLNDEKRRGVFQCAACDNRVYTSITKFDSGTGWPSFYAPVTDSVGTMEDRSLLMTRTEVHCARCGSHLGHVFDDGPPPTGKRHCINGVAMTFQPVPKG
jgi:peptide-methionine (R)-S-oxide reductase